MSQWRKKPVVVEAERVNLLIINAMESWGALPDWVRKHYEDGHLVFCPKTISVHTLEGIMIADWSDWLIQGIKGEIYPCKDEIFRATYDLADISTLICGDAGKTRDGSASAVCQLPLGHEGNHGGMGCEW
jgi:hypothetical protein